MNSPRTLLIMAGGTAGHVMPALAVAEVLHARGWVVHWMGTPDGMENRLVAAVGYPMHGVPFAGLRGKGLWARLSLPWRLARALVAAWSVLRRVRPAVVLGMGGYISVPGGLVARLRGCATLIHEQNRIAGSANRLLARAGARVLESFPDTLAGARHVGNPVRASIARLAEPTQRYAGRTGPLQILVVGGSLGAAALNACVPAALALLPPDTRPQVTHQSGASHLDRLREHYAQMQVEGQLLAFIDDMASAYGQADLVICRAGATTIAELAVAGLPAILVPYPHAIDDHQTANARYLVQEGAAILMPQSEFDPGRLAACLSGLTRDELARMAVRARALGRPGAAVMVADECEEVAR